MATLDSFKPPYREIADYIARCRRLAYVSNEKQVWTVDERPHEDAATVGSTPSHSDSKSGPFLVLFGCAVDRPRLNATNRRPPEGNVPPRQQPAR